MKSINLTYSHKELQFHLFAAITFGFQAAIAKGYFLTFESTNDSFIWKVFKSATAPENGDAKELYSYPVNRGVYQLNDVRLGIMSKYMEDQCWRFLMKLPAEILKGQNSATSELLKQQRQICAEAYERNTNTGNFSGEICEAIENAEEPKDTSTRLG